VVAAAPDHAEQHEVGYSLCASVEPKRFLLEWPSHRISSLVKAARVGDTRCTVALKTIRHRTGLCQQTHFRAVAWTSGRVR